MENVKKPNEEYDSKKEAWLEDMKTHFSLLSNETAKVSLDLASRFLDHQFAANEAISNKARIAVASVIAVFSALIPFLSTYMQKCGENLPFVLLLGGLAAIASIVAYCHFMSIIKAREHFHSGVSPLKQLLIEDAKEITEEEKKVFPQDFGKDEADATHARFVVYVLYQYESSIAKNKAINTDIASAFNKGIFSLSASAFLWALAFTVAATSC